MLGGSKQPSMVSGLAAVVQHKLIQGHSLGVHMGRLAQLLCLERCSTPSCEVTRHSHQATTQYSAKETVEITHLVYTLAGWLKYCVLKDAAPQVVR